MYDPEVVHHKNEGDKKEDRQHCLLKIIIYIREKSGKNELLQKRALDTFRIYLAGSKAIQRQNSSHPCMNTRRKGSFGSTHSRGLVAQFPNEEAEGPRRIESRSPKALFASLSFTEKIFILEI